MLQYILELCRVFYHDKVNWVFHASHISFIPNLGPKVNSQGDKKLREICVYAPKQQNSKKRTFKENFILTFFSKK